MTISDLRILNHLSNSSSSTSSVAPNAMTLAPLRVLRGGTAIPEGGSVQVSAVWCWRPPQSSLQDTTRSSFLGSGRRERDRGRGEVEVQTLRGRVEPLALHTSEAFIWVLVDMQNTLNAAVNAVDPTRTCPPLALSLFSLPRLAHNQERDRAYPPLYLCSLVPLDITRERQRYLTKLSPTLP